MTPEASVLCPMCGSEAQAQAEDCSICGYSLVASNNEGGGKCARCGSAVPSGYAYCPVCGLDQRHRLARPPTRVVQLHDEDDEPAEDGGDSYLEMEWPTPAEAEAPGPAARTGRTQFVQGPPVLRPPVVHEDDRTTPVPGRARPAAPPPEVHASAPTPPFVDPGRDERGPEAAYGPPAGSPAGSYGSPGAGYGPSSASQGAPGAAFAPAPEQVPGAAYAPSSGSLGGPGAAYTPAAPGPEIGPGPAHVPPEPLAESAAATGIARLVLVGRDGEEGESFPLLGSLLEIGRTHGELRFPEDRFMSPAHARIDREPQGFRLHDMGSLNGVFLRIRGHAAVYPGDLFMVGHQVLRLENVAEMAHELAPAPDGTRYFGTPLKPAWGKLTLVGRGAVPGDVHFLRGAKVVFGREQGDILFPQDPFVSREHARLRLELHGHQMSVFLEDLGSANGTYVRIRGSTEIRPRDTFRIGDQILRLRLDT